MKEERLRAQYRVAGEGPLQEGEEAGKECQRQRAGKTVQSETKKSAWASVIRGTVIHKRIERTKKGEEETETTMRMYDGASPKDRAKRTGEKYGMAVSGERWTRKNGKN